MNQYSQNTLKGWFFDVGYLYVLVVAIVALGFVIKSLDLRSAPEGSAVSGEYQDVTVAEP